MSPKEVKMTSPRPTIAIALSIISSGVTQTGQPVSVDERNLFGKEMVNSKFHNCMSLTSTNLHHGPLVLGDFMNQLRVFFCGVCVSIFVDILHGLR